MFHSSFGTLLLTEERLHHILSFHPEIKLYLELFAATLAQPDCTTASVHDPHVVICSRFLSLRKRHLMIVVHTKKHFIVTAYLARKLRQDKL